MSDSPGLVCFALELGNSILNLPDEQVIFFVTNNFLKQIWFNKVHSFIQDKWFKIPNNI